ncbi:MAG: carboxypeptidase-like regulatory domain-containing protein [Spirosomaceae bacterium]|nr:carboxypeptidase-like regulatory domain-containing protein [Spirosomataceae bacterium]
MIQTSKVLLFLLLINLSAIAQKGYIVGRVVNKENQKGVPSATVINKNSKQVTKTGANGDFFLYVSFGDSIKITSIGYAETGITWDGINKEPVIEAKPTAIMLGEVVVKTQRPENLSQRN